MAVMRSTAGMSLLELLFALLITTFALLASATLFRTSIWGEVRSRDTIQTAYEAQSRLERIIDLPYWEMISAAPTESEVSVRTDPDSPFAGVSTVEVEVRGPRDIRTTLVLVREEGVWR